jgi:PAS domain S-box-containing protein
LTNHQISRPSGAAFALGVYTLIAGLISFLGWLLDFPRLADWDGTGLCMQPNTTVAAMAAGCSLIFLVLGRRRASAIFAALVFLIGSATIFQYLSGVNLHFDSWLLFGRTWGTKGTIVYGRMGPPACVSWTLLGLAMMFAALGGRRLRSIAPKLAMLVASIAALSLAGYSFGAGVLYSLPRLTVIAFQTSTMILAISFGLIAAVPEQQPMRIILENSAAGTLARRLVPFAILVPGVVGFLRWQGEAAGLYDTAFGTAMRTIIEMVLLLALVWWGAAAVQKQEQNLRRKERELADFFENATVGLHWVGPDGTILRVNKAEVDMLGYSREEYLGHNIAEFHVDEPIIQDILTCLLRGEDLHERPARLRCKDGSVRDVLISSNALFDDGKFVHTRCFTQDITERKKADQELRLNQELIETVVRNLDVGAALIRGSDLRFQMINKGYQSLSPGREIIGKTVYEIWPEVQPEFGQRCRQVLESGEPFEAVDEPHRIAMSDGSLSELRYFTWSMHRVRLPKEEGWGLLVSAYETTNRKQVESALRETELTLRESDRRKDEFLATLSHELRNPLAPLRNTLNILLRKETQTNSEACPSLDLMDRQLSHMVRLIDDLLDVSRISRGKIELRKSRVELASILNQAVEATRPAMDSARHKLTITLPKTPVFLQADPVRLVQIFANLLSNACKYTDPDGRIGLAANALNGDVIVTVRDSGIGIPSDMLSNIFEMFTQVDKSLERAQGGLGIGLTLVRRLVELHHGTIEAHSAGIGQGSEFVVRLPTLAEIPEPPAFPSDKPKITPRRILVVDDNEDSARSMAMIMKLDGHDAHVAFDGVAALAAAEALLPEVVLLDIGLPKLNGYDACRKIRQQSWGQDIAIIALTGWGQEDDRLKSKNAGFDAHLIKPVDQDELARLISEISAPRAIQSSQA